MPYKTIYILLGGLAIVVGICVLIWLPDSPVHAQFLTKEERIAALERVRDDQGGTENKHFKKEQVRLLRCALCFHVGTKVSCFKVWETLRDVRTWLIVVATLTSKHHDSLGSPCVALMSMLQQVSLTEH